ncbi:hypothetical protein PR202_gb03827 [Eleusine coracana subsp. coracana]|uniref:Protein kinase domain-containing protein n=1 Tax=Eleusine coracana subsp. coracana TaxID=191504 RepID=A0AAV5E2P3_ELECO|nr:hypothetical protein PR202_gb03827 [Eleusine coracana subsp. coracana]
MSCFVCFGSAQDGDPKKPGADAKDARKGAPPDRVVTRVGSDKSRSQGASDSKKDIIIHRDGSSQNIAAQTFTFRELAAATKNFRQDCLLGEGGFGRVYKGRLENGQNSTSQAVAVKQLDRNGLQGNREFLVEVLMLSLLHHTNLVNLIGYCADGDQRLLVYEFMPLGSLEDHLHEYAMTGQLTVKSDVYSFGVVFLELITGRKAIDNTKPQGEQNLVAWARPLFKDRRKFPQMADPMLQGRFPMRGLYQALAVAAMCLQEQAATRPHIGDVVTALSYLASQTYDPNAPVQRSRSNSSTPRARNPAGWNDDQRNVRSPNHPSPDLRRREAARTFKYGAEVRRTSSAGESGRRSGLDDMDVTGSQVGSPAQTGRRREASRTADRQRAIAEARMWGENSRERSNGHGSFDSTNE